MTDTLIIKTLTEEQSRILNKANGKRLVLVISTKDGKTRRFKANSVGGFYKGPELIDGNLKIAVADVSLSSESFTDVNGVTYKKVTQPITYDYIDPNEINAMRWEFEIESMSETESVTAETIEHNTTENTGE